MCREVWDYSVIYAVRKIWKQARLHSVTRALFERTAVLMRTPRRTRDNGAPAGRRGN